MGPQEDKNQVKLKVKIYQYHGKYISNTQANKHHVAFERHKKCSFLLSPKSVTPPFHWYNLHKVNCT